MTIWNDEKLEKYFENNYAKLNPASINLSLSCFVREARWYWNTPLFFRRLVWRGLGKPNTWDSKNEHLFWQSKSQAKIMRSKAIKNDWYWLWPNKFVLLSARQKLFIPVSSAGILISTSSSGRVGFNHSHAGWFDPGFVGYPTFEYLNIAPWPIPLWEGLQTIQLVMFDLSKAAGLGYDKTGRYQNQGMMPQTVKEEREKEVSK